MKISFRIITLGMSRPQAPVLLRLAILPPSSFKGLAYLRRFSSFCILFDFSSSWFRWQMSVDGERFIPLNPMFRRRCLKYNTPAIVAAQMPIMIKQIRAIRYLLLCGSSEIRAVSTFTSTIEVSASREVCFRDIASPKIRIPSRTPSEPDCKHTK